MIESLKKSMGAKVVVAASRDENHLPENIIDGNTRTFWMTTGMFPQEFIIRFADPTNITAVTVDSYNVKHLKIERNTSQHASQFEFVTEKEFERTDGHLQSNSLSLNGSSATHLRFIITSGYDHFVSVHKLEGQGMDFTSMVSWVADTLHTCTYQACSRILLCELNPTVASKDQTRCNGPVPPSTEMMQTPKRKYRSRKDT